MKLLILNGPNLNMLGIREPEIYGKVNYKTLCKMIKDYAKKKQVKVILYQSNHEGDIIDRIQKAYFEKIDGIVINPGGYTHTSVAILDALKATNIKTVEVHISDINQRETFRNVSYVSLYSNKTIKGLGVNGYLRAIDYFAETTGEYNGC